MKNIKLHLPKKSIPGLKIYCNKCKKDKPICTHYDEHKFRIRCHIPGTKSNVKTKILECRDYNGAVIEAIQFKEFLKSQNFVTQNQDTNSKDFLLIDAIVIYNQYLRGEHQFAHRIKTVSKGHQKEAIRYCIYFSNSIKKHKDLKRVRVIEISQAEVGEFYKWTESNFSSKSVNKIMAHLKAFFKYLIEVEEIEMKNPFENYESKRVSTKQITTLNKLEFEKILIAVKDASPIKEIGTKGLKKNLYRNYLIDGFRLFLLTGGRREEIVNLKWSDIQITIKGVKFFKIPNLKVARKTKKDSFKFVPINADLNKLLEELGYQEKKASSDYILFPERKVKSITIMNDLSKAFTHYKNMAKIEKEVSLNNLRKTYISWVHEAMSRETGILTSHSTYEVLLNHYIDPTILNAIEKGANDIKIFG